MPGAVKRQFCSVTKNDFETYISSASVIIKSKNRPVTCFYPKGTVTTVQSTGIPILTIDTNKLITIGTILQRPFCTSQMFIQGDGFFKVTDLLCLSLSI